jgi:hypothetical protein
MQIVILFNSDGRRGTEFAGVGASLAVVGMVCLLASCQSHLTRSNAKSQLEGLQESPHVYAHVGTLSGDCGGLHDPNYDPTFDYGNAVLSATGYVTIRPVRRHVWEVELTQLGDRSVDQLVMGDGGKYAHDKEGDCDSWQIDFALSKYDHLDVTGILEDGIHAKVETSTTFVVTPVGLAVRKQAESVIVEVHRRVFGDNVATPQYSRERVKAMLGDLFNSPPDADRYVKYGSFTFVKFDDGWRVQGPSN